MGTESAPPGPKRHFLTGNLPEFRRDRLAFYSSCARKHGDFVPLRLGPRKVFLVSHPDLIKEVLVTKGHDFRKIYMLRLSRLVFGDGLLTSEGDVWHRQRRLAQPAFHHDRIASYGQVMADHAERMMHRWRDGETRDVHAEMMGLTLLIVAETLFGAHVAAETDVVAGAVDLILERFVARLESLVPLPDTTPTPGNLRARRVVGRLDRIVYGVIADRRATGEDRGDLLSMLLHAQDEDGSGMSDKQLRDEVMTLLMTGHETTAIALTWTWYLLSQHAGAERKLHAELEQVLGGRQPAVSDLPRLPYTEMVVKESMRLFPPAYAFGRDAVRDSSIGGYRVPKGSTVIASPWVMHRDPRFFDDPLAFDPDRWADGLSKKLPRFVYFPFGGGPRMCIGSSFAMAEAVVVLASIAQRFRLRLAPGHQVELWPAITLRPKHGMRMVLQERAAESSGPRNFVENEHRSWAPVLEPAWRH